MPGRGEDAKEAAHDLITCSRQDSAPFPCSLNTKDTPRLPANQRFSTATVLETHSEGLEMLAAWVPTNSSCAVKAPQPGERRTALD